MRTSDVLLLTSHSEGGGPRVVLEALGSGLPVVSLAVGEVERLVSDDVNGWVARSRTPDALASGLLRVLVEPREALVAGAIAAVRDRTAPRVLGELYAAHRQIALRS